ncbi:MAG: glycosyltransferase [Ardenticatenaceae bacterium]|nr:glycosyltransferase [Ardenticatenaceae bacterium]
MSPTAIHFHRAYLALSETFIYQYLTNLHAYRPIMLARFAQNLSNFPFADVYTLSQLPLLARYWNYAWFRLRRQSPYFNQIIRRERPSLLHAHFGTEGVYALPTHHLFDLPLLTTFYGKDMSQQAQEPRWQAGYKRLFAQGTLFLVEGNHMKKSLIALGCPPEKIRISHIGVDTQKFNFKPRVYPADDQVNILMCGRLTEKKGVAYAIEAVSRLTPQYPHIRLRIIGDGPLRTDLENLIHSRQIQAQVQILGYLSHAAYAQEMANAHLFLAPSVLAADGDSEGGAPTVILEAQAAGVPVVASTHADIPEVVGIKEPGYLVPERDSEALAARLHEMLQNPQKWPEWGQISRHHVEAEYDIRQVARMLESIYDEAIYIYQKREMP